MPPRNEAYETHRLKETFAIPGPIPPGQRLNVGKAVLAIAGADGELSPTEMETFLAIQRGYGVGSDTIEALQDFDYKKARLDDLLDAGTKPFARAILYDALRVARADGISPQEHEAALRMAKKVGVAKDLVPALESLLDMDQALVGAKLKLLGSI